MVDISAAHQIVPPGDPVPVDLRPGYELGLGHSLLIADETVKLSKYAA